MNNFSKIDTWLSSRNIQLSLRDQAFIRSRTAVRTVRANELLMVQDQEVEKFYFLNKGIVRLYRNYEGVDHTLGLIDSHDFLAAPQLILGNEISTCGLETLTEVTILEWNRADIQFIKHHIPHVYTIELSIMSRLLNWVQQNQVEQVCFSAEKRYQLILERQPGLLLQIPLKYIASFLGIHTDSLSRIRKKLT